MITRNGFIVRPSGTLFILLTNLSWKLLRNILRFHLNVVCTSHSKLHDFVVEIVVESYAFLIMIPS